MDIDRGILGPFLEDLEALNPLQRTLLAGTAADEDALEDERLAETYGLSPGAVRAERDLLRRLLRQGLHEGLRSRR